MSEKIGIGTRIYKPLDTPEKNYFYADCVVWAKNNGAFVQEFEEYFEVVVLERPPLPELEAYKEQRKNELNTLHEAAEKEAHILSSLGFEIDANDRANRDIAGLLITTEEGETVNFCDYSNVMRQVNREQLEIMQKEIIQNAQSLYAQKWAFRSQIDACETSVALSGLNFTFFYESFYVEPTEEPTGEGDQSAEQAE